jgi:hypothetical protein
LTIRNKLHWKKLIVLVEKFERNKPKVTFAADQEHWRLRAEAPDFRVPHRLAVAQRYRVGD